MTPKEKAERLIIKLYIEGDMLKENPSYKLAKKCALIAVDEIIKANPYKISKTDMDSTIDYWAEVKQEIEKL